MAGLEGEDLLSRGVGRLADGDGHRRGRRLQARRHIDGVADEEPLAESGVDLEAHQRLAGVDPHPDLDGAAGDAGQGVDLVDEAQTCAHRPFGVVLVQDGHAEHGDDGVADELLHRPAVGLDRLASHGVVAAQEAVDQLGVVALRERGEADEVAEERGDDAALFGVARGRPLPAGGR